MPKQNKTDHNADIGKMVSKTPTEGKGIKEKYPFSNLKEFATYCYAMDIKLKLFGNGSGDCMICGTNYRILFEAFKKSHDEIKRLKGQVKNLIKKNNL